MDKVKAFEVGADDVLATARDMAAPALAAERSHVSGIKALF